MEAGKSKSQRGSQQSGNLGKAHVVVLNVKARNSGRISMLQSEGKFHFLKYLSAAQYVWDFSSLPRDQTHAPCTGSEES